MSQRGQPDPAGRRLGMVLRRLPFNMVAFTALGVLALVGWPVLLADRLSQVSRSTSDRFSE